MKHHTKEREAHQDQIPENHQQKNPADIGRGRIKAELYTDPLCCWSWAFEKPWRQLIDKYGDMISYRYVMGGMIPDWNSYNDPMNAVSRPLQMGPVWMHASQVTHVKMRYDIWHADPPSSSFPACIAVKTAELQSQKAGENYLFEIRRHLMEEAENISRQDVLLSIAEKIQDLDVARFKSDWEAGAGKNAFREDLKKVKVQGITRFPSVTLVNDAGEGVVIVGYRPFEVLEQAFRTVPVS